MYEASERVGGRLRAVSVGGRRFEAGGKHIHERNRCIDSFVDRFGFQRRPVSRGAERTGVWDGRRFPLTTAGTEPVTLFRLLTRYGLSPRRARAEAVADRFDAIYDHAETAFETPERLFEAVGLGEVCTQSGREFLIDHGVGSQFVDELVAGTTRTIYGQDPTLNALACLVALTGMGSGTYTLDVANADLCRRLLADADAAGVAVRVRRRNGGSELAGVPAIRPGDADTAVSTRRRALLRERDGVGGVDDGDASDRGPDGRESGRARHLNGEWVGLRPPGFEGVGERAGELAVRQVDHAEGRRPVERMWHLHDRLDGVDESERPRDVVAGPDLKPVVVGKRLAVAHADCLR
ncbi:hypothetical protein DMP03_06560 [Halosegnis rubeus]|uniref:Amine oxidase domain-containing protein n=1 Tax=Halosegnis rubeus TaxID=2212850 RepID=A0A5N5UE83_9EURY|nr:hypothetical protein DMP03_06560 [Halosegnis rubeus]